MFELVTNQKIMAVGLGLLIMTKMILTGPVVGQEVSFQREILPILSDRCFVCHGPDAAANESELRLDLPEMARGELPSGDGFAVVPGAPAQSDLFKRVNSRDPDTQMPPPDSNRKPLTAAEIQLLERWITQGAEYQRHWSWVPVPDTIAVPNDPTDSWSRNEIDRFVFSKLKSTRMSPAREAERWRWLRRVSLDLSGFPPTIDELNSFLADDRPEAYDQVVDRLLNAPTFGEQMAVSWLDAARYADSYGYQSDQLCTTWPYRDWVVRAFNQNLPYDQFLIWQIAGDLLPEPTVDQRIATAFNRLHRQTNEGGSIDLEWRMEYAADRVKTFGSAILGLTLECCRCHDHKFDPITQRDFYQLTSFFNNIDEYGLYNNTPWVPTPSLLLPDASQRTRMVELEQKLDEAKKLLAHARVADEQKLADWLAKRPSLTELRPKVAVDFERRTAEHQFGPDGGFVANTSANNPVVEGHQGSGLQFSGDDRLEVNAFHFTLAQPFTTSFWVKVPRELHDGVVFHEETGTDVGFSGVELTLKADRLFFAYLRFWPGNALAVETIDEFPKDRWVHVAVTYDGSFSAEGMKIFVDGQCQQQILRNQIYKHSASSDKLHFGEKFRAQGLAKSSIDEIQIFDQALSTIEVKTLGSGKGLEEVLAQGSKDEQAEYFLMRHSAEYAEAMKGLTAAEEARVAHNDSMVELMVMEEMKDVRPTYLLERGEYNAPRTPERLVTRDTISGLYPFDPQLPRNRLGLAQWVVDPRHPLTARVAVNRIWQGFFGTGLVASAGDFGLQGTQPTHPELLDWLARDFVSHQWDVKRLCRQIVLSATYRQNSRSQNESAQEDPQNEFLSRASAQRLSAEQIRDLALFASGLYRPRDGGPPVSPYQPADLWRENNTMSPAYHQSTGDDPFRRSLYSVWKRTAPLPNMIAFDAAGREVCSASRTATNTPVQALVVLNDPQFVEAACHLAWRFAKEPESIERKIELMFASAASRFPDDFERSVLKRLFDEQLVVFNETPGDIEKLFALGSKLIPLEGLTPETRTELAALAMVGQAILNSDAALYKR